MTCEDTPTTWRHLWQVTSETLGSRVEARWMCEQACGLDGDEFLEALDESPTVRMVAHLDAMVARRRSGEPLAYVLGRWSFRHLDVMVDRRVLIPRPETELLVDAVLERLDRVTETPGRSLVVDLGTGSGVIGLAVAQETWPREVEVWLSDVSAEALEVARANLAGLGRRGAGVRVVEGSWFDALPGEIRGEIDLVVANPPYVAIGDPELASEVQDWEPAGALFAGSDGLEDLRLLISQARTWLRASGWVVFEIGHTQGAAVTALLEAHGYDEIELRQDLAGRDRILVARSPWVHP